MATKEKNLTEKIMKVLSRKGDVSARELADRTETPIQQVCARLLTLVNRGAVERSGSRRSFTYSASASAGAEA